MLVIVFFFGWYAFFDFVVFRIAILVYEAFWNAVFGWNAILGLPGQLECYLECYFGL